MFCYLHISISTPHPWLPDNDCCCLCRPAEHPHVPHQLTGVTALMCQCLPVWAYAPGSETFGITCDTKRLNLWITM